MFNRKFLIGFILIAFLPALIAIMLDETVAKDSVSITQYEWREKGIASNNKKVGFWIENKNDVSVDIEITYELYNERAYLKDTKKQKIYAVAPNSRYFAITDDLDHDVDKIKMEWTVEKSIYNGLQKKDIDANCTWKGENLFITVTNNTDRMTKDCIATLIFYNYDNKIRRAETVRVSDEGKIPSHYSIEQKFPTAFTLWDRSFWEKWEETKIEIYINAYTDD